MANGGTGAAALPLAEKVFEWARAVNPAQPLTLGAWDGNKEMNDIIFRHSDIITFHNYSKADSLRSAIATLKKHGRPIISTEWLNRPGGSSVEGCLPVFVMETIAASRK